MPRAPNNWEAPESPNNVASFSSIQYIYSQKTLGSDMGAPNLFLAPGAIYPRYARVTPWNPISGSCT